jgi:hypothetical protein
LVRTDTILSAMRQPSAEEKEALLAFVTQREQINAIANKDVHDPAFISWKTVTTEVFERFLPESAFRFRFGSASFHLLSDTGDPAEAYAGGIRTAKRCLDAAIEHIEHSFRDWE